MGGEKDRSWGAVFARCLPDDLCMIYGIICLFFSSASSIATTAAAESAAITTHSAARHSLHHHTHRVVIIISLLLLTGKTAQVISKGEHEIAGKVIGSAGNKLVSGS